MTAPRASLPLCLKSPIRKTIPSSKASLNPWAARVHRRGPELQVPCTHARATLAGMSESCDECTRFRSNSGLLVRAFECDGQWPKNPYVSLTRRGEDHPLNLPMSRFGFGFTRPGHDKPFYPPEHGASLLALALSNSSDEHVEHFRSCAHREVFLPILRRSTLRRRMWENKAKPRPTSLLQEDITNDLYPVYSNSFGFTLHASAGVHGAHAFDAWTTKQRPFCEDEAKQAEVRLDAVRRFCDLAHDSSGKKNQFANGLFGDKPLDVARLQKHWPPHLALSRTVAATKANCRFKTTKSMLRQQTLFFSKLRASSSLLQRCPYARYAGAINQVAAMYNRSHITGIYVLDWVPSHLPLATLAFKELPPWLDEVEPSREGRRLSWNRRARPHEPLKLVRFSRPHVGSHALVCTCHELPRSRFTEMITTRVEDAGVELLADTA
jgi:hypothetical protein